MNTKIMTFTITANDAANGHPVPPEWEAECVMFAREAYEGSRTILDPNTGKARIATPSWLPSLPVVVLRRVAPKTRKVIRFVEDVEGEYQEVTFSWGYKMERRFEFLTGLPRYRREETEEPIA